MDGYNFYMKRVLRSSDGTLSVESGSQRDLEADFPGLRYKSCDGLGAYGAQRVYAETYAESDAAEVYVPASGVREQTDVTLTLYFFDPSGSKGYGEAIKGAEVPYRSFMEYVSGTMLIYWDTARRRKVLLYLAESVSPTTDSLKSLVYKEVALKFKSVTGRSYAAYASDGTEDTTLEQSLNSLDAML